MAPFFHLGQGMLAEGIRLFTAFLKKLCRGIAMRVDIFDVGHGACSVITCPDGKRLMIDCGSKGDPP